MDYSNNIELKKEHFRNFARFLTWQLAEFRFTSSDYKEHDWIQEIRRQRFFLKTIHLECWCFFRFLHFHFVFLRSRNCYQIHLEASRYQIDYNQRNATILLAGAKTASQVLSRIHRHLDILYFFSVSEDDSDALTAQRTSLAKHVPDNSEDTKRSVRCPRKSCRHDVECSKSPRRSRRCKGCNARNSLHDTS